jgi:creatinine amidohydrolase
MATEPAHLTAGSPRPVATELARLTSPELEPADPLLLVPIGATEQHGPHLPLGTDTALAVALANGAAERCRGVLVAPAVAYGSSGEHDGFAGTLSIGQRATQLLLVELCRSASATFRRVGLVCAHGGNAEPVRRAVAILRGEGRDVWSFVPSWVGDAHAGHTETSLMLAVAPELVQMANAEPGETRPLREMIGALRAQGVRAVSANGVLGDPAGADREHGQQLLEAATRALVAQLEAWR